MLNKGEKTTAYFRIHTAAGLLISGLLCSSTSAIAEDRTIAYDWSGFYAGVNAGYVWANQSSLVNRDLTNLTDHIDALSNGFDVRGPAGGAQFGYNYSTSTNIVFGLEGDFGLAIANGSVSTSFFDVGGGPGGTDITRINELGTDYGFMASIRPRIGFTSGQILLYATGGLAVAGYRDSLRYSDDQGGVNKIDSNNTALGWTAGLGAEVALENDWSVKGEYLHSDFGSNTVSTGGYWGTGSSSFTIDHTVDLVRIGFNKKF
jgi:outer membrane immunogenic protein